MYIPEQGDIVFINFEASAGKEITKRRPAFVLSRKMFNEHSNLAIVAPVTSTIRSMGMEIVLSEAMATKGAILIAQMKSFDYAERIIEFVEKAPDSVTQEALKKAALIVS